MTDPGRRAAVAAAAARFIDLVRGLPDPALTVRGSPWSCADTAAHVAVVVGSYQPYLTGRTEPILDYRDLPASNARTLAAYPTRDPATLAEDIAGATTAFLDLTAGRDGSEPMPWHGTALPIQAVYGIYLAELLLHGRDVAAANGRPWPITQADAAIAVDGAIEAAPLFVDRARSAGLTASYRVQLRGAGGYEFRFKGGELTVEREPVRRGHPDCRIVGAPLSVLLVIYRRSSLWRQVATGRLLAAGRRPWLGPRFPNLFVRF